MAILLDNSALDQSKYLFAYIPSYLWCVFCYVFRPTYQLELIMAIMTLVITTIDIYNDNFVLIVYYTHNNNKGAK